MSDATKRRYWIDTQGAQLVIMFGVIPVSSFFTSQKKQVESTVFELNSLYNRVKELGDKVQELRG